MTEYCHIEVNIVVTHIYIYIYHCKNKSASLANSYHLNECSACEIFCGRLVYSSISSHCMNTFPVLQQLPFPGTRPASRRLQYGLIILQATGSWVGAWEWGQLLATESSHATAVTKYSI